MLEDQSKMLRGVNLLLVLISLLCAAITPASAQQFPSSGRSANVEVNLKSARTTVAPGETFYVALEQKIARGWHTYWRNPGDSGEPTSIAWTLPTGVSAAPIVWPTPTAIPFGPLVNYGFSGEVVLPVAIKIPASAKIGEALDLVADVRWLECADICIPGEAKVALRIDVAASGSNSADKALIDRSLAALPTPFPGSAALTDLGSGGLQLVLKGMDTPRDAYFFAYEVKSGAVVDSAQPQVLVRGKDGYGLTLVKSPSFPTDLKGPVGGVLVLGKGTSAKAFEIAADFEAAPPSAAPAAVGETKRIAPADPLQTDAGIGLLMALILAVAGGLILNLMPCVFPILSMKALGLIAASHQDTKAALAHGLWYGAGVIISFLTLAGALLGLKSLGIAAGWGFQLQNPAIVLSLAILMVWIGFNLLGFFEIGGRLQNIGGSVSSTKDARGSLLTGMLAVVVAAPCTAPFMGAALGYAATQAPFISLLVFLALAIGFALPFVALTFMPNLLRALPRPGPWMIKLREALAFPMFATAAWLIWVASAQAGQTGVLAALVGILGAGLAVWVTRTWPNLTGKAAATLIGLGSLIWAIQHILVAQPTGNTQTAEANDAWSEARVALLQSQGKSVFVNFTADWCVTCKVNEVSVFRDPNVRAALSGGKAVYLVADWTSRDDAIAQALAAHGRAGVPLYLVYTPGDDTPRILPQILTSRIVLDALN